MSSTVEKGRANFDDESNNRQLESVYLDLPAPHGWKKKFIPRKGGTPKRNEVIFISPTGDEIKSIKELEKYHKSHPGGPSLSEFDWGTGDSPRRSARISERIRTTATNESEPPKKRERKPSSLKGDKDKSVINAAEEITEIAEENDSNGIGNTESLKILKESTDIKMEDVVKEYDVKETIEEENVKDKSEQTKEDLETKNEEEMERIPLSMEGNKTCETLSDNISSPKDTKEQEKEKKEKEQTPPSDDINNPKDTKKEGKNETTLTENIVVHEKKEEENEQEHAPLPAIVDNHNDQQGDAKNSDQSS